MSEHRNEIVCFSSLYFISIDIFIIYWWRPIWNTFILKTYLLVFVIFLKTPRDNLEKIMLYEIFIQLQHFLFLLYFLVLICQILTFLYAHKFLDTKWRNDSGNEFATLLPIPQRFPMKNLAPQ